VVATRIESSGVAIFGEKEGVAGLIGDDRVGRVVVLSILGGELTVAARLIDGA
jgi:hypothetical protein